MTKDKYHWFPFYPAAWLQDPELSRCSESARGVWIDLICLMFESDERGVLVSCGDAWTVDDAARALRGDFHVCLSSVQELLRCGVLRRRKDGAMYCSRMVREEELRQVRSESGRKGGLAKAKQNASKHPSKSLGVSLASSSNSNSRKKKKEEEKERVRTLYEAYPRHVGKKAAEKAIGKALRAVEFDVLKAAVERYARSREGEDAQFTPYPATWFNAGRWADETDKASTDGNPWFQEADK
jgi:hypothetical protein